MEPRLFIAFKIIPSEEMLNALKTIKQTFVQSEFSWVNPDNYHITLKFFGATPVSQIQLIKKAMEQAFLNESSCEISLESLGIFGSSYSPKVLWTHVYPTERCKIWYNKLKESLINYGFEYDRQNFVPHLTLARIKHLDDKSLINKTIEKYKGFCFLEYKVEKISLYESILKPKGAEYINHFSICLR
jgi:2'-5' RNA ligase